MLGISKRLNKFYCVIYPWFLVVKSGYNKFAPNEIRNVKRMAIPRDRTQKPTRLNLIFIVIYKPNTKWYRFVATCSVHCSIRLHAIDSHKIHFRRTVKFARLQVQLKFNYNPILDSFAFCYQKTVRPMQMKISQIYGLLTLFTVFDIKWKCFDAKLETKMHGIARNRRGFVSVAIYTKPRSHLISKPYDMNIMSNNNVRNAYSFVFNLVGKYVFTFLVAKLKLITFITNGTWLPINWIGYRFSLCLFFSLSVSLIFLSPSLALSACWSSLASPCPHALIRQLFRILSCSLASSQTVVNFPLSLPFNQINKHLNN